MWRSWKFRAKINPILIITKVSKGCFPVTDFSIANWFVVESGGLISPVEDRCEMYHNEWFSSIVLCFPLFLLVRWVFILLLPSKEKYSVIIFLYNPWRENLYYELYYKFMRFKFIGGLCALSKPWRKNIPSPTDTKIIIFHVSSEGKHI